MTIQLKAIEINSLDRFHKSFDAAQYQAVRKALAGRDRVRANLVVHPFFCYQNLKALRSKNFSDLRSQLELTHNPVINHEIRQAEATNSQASYTAYMNRLGKHLRSTLAPIFIFAAAPDRVNIIKWLDQLHHFATPIIMVDALGRDATPSFDTVLKDKEAWNHLSDIFKDLMLQELEIAGEKAYQVGEQKFGCVYCVADNLRSRFFSITVKREIVYPNINLP